MSSASSPASTSPFQARGFSDSRTLAASEDEDSCSTASNSSRKTANSSINDSSKAQYTLSKMSEVLSENSDCFVFDAEGIQPAQTSSNVAFAYSTMNPSVNNSIIVLKRSLTGRSSPDSWCSPSVDTPSRRHTAGFLFVLTQRSRRQYMVLGVLLLLVILGWLKQQGYMTIEKIQNVRPSKHLHDMAEYGIKAVPHILDGGCESSVVNSTYIRELQSRWNFGNHVRYAQREVRYRPTAIPRKPVTKVKQRMFPAGRDFQVMDILGSHDGTSDGEDKRCIAPLTVEIPSSRTPQQVNASHLLFGISTTKERLKDEKVFREWSVWLTDGKGNSNGAGLQLLLTDATIQDISEVRQRLLNYGVVADISASNSSEEMSARYLSLVPALYRNPSRLQRKWFVLCDDDTFFPTIQTLIAQLEVADASLDMYIGTFSEDFNNIDRHGSQAFGGAGVFISRSLSAKITALYDHCSTSSKLKEADSGWGSQGDILLRKCIYENTNTRLTLMRGLHQLDFSGDGSGFYESGMLPLSLHHFKGGMWHEADPFESVKSSKVLGEESFLMRVRTTDDWVLSNGYSIANYPRGIDFDLEQVEKTFSFNTEDRDWNMDLMLGPMRQSLSKTGRKIAWRHVESDILPTGVVRQVYLKEKDDDRWLVDEEPSRTRVDSIIILLWSPA